MAIKASGNLSMLNDIVAEFGGSEPHKISDYYSEGTLPTTGYITFSDFYGQSGAVVINITISSNTNNYNIFNNKGGTYSPGITTVNVTINSGVTVGSTSTGTYALDTGSGWASGDVINITNNGTIKGRGANGGTGGSAQNNPFTPSAGNGASGGTGGPAFRAQFACTFTNNGSVYGGGGGGGGGGGAYARTSGKLITDDAYGGGGGGGGAGVNAGTTGNPGANGTATAGGTFGLGGGIGSPSGGSGGVGGGLGSNGSSGSNGTTGTSPTGRGLGGSGGTRGFYQVGASSINGGSGVGGTVGGRSS